jgi:hypothetical protein
LTGLTFQKLAYPKRRLGHCFPGHALARIEVDHEAIRPFELLDGGAPRMQLDGADRDKAKEAVKAVHPQSRAFAALTFSYVQLMTELGMSPLAVVPCGRRSFHAHAAPA